MPDLLAASTRGRLPVFVSSTFQDMDRERDLIVHVVVPVVNDRLRRQGYRVELYPVDLRWGVSSDQSLATHEREQSILSTCVGEVIRCRPFFVGLIGERIGWLPPRPLQRAILARAGLPDPGFGVSATALEVIAAVRAGVRDGHPPILLRRHSGVALAHHAGPPGDIQQLVDYAAAQGVPIRDYAPVVSVDTAGRDEFTSELTEELFRLAASVLRPAVPSAWLDDELDAQAKARTSLADSFVGRRDEVERVRSFWKRDTVPDRLGDALGSEVGKLRPRWDSHALAVIGESGSGKSAMLAFIADRVTIAHEFENLLRELIGAGGVASIHASIGVTAASHRLPVILLLLLAQVDIAAARTIAAGCAPFELVLSDVEPSWIEALSAMSLHDSRVVIVDGLDRLQGPAFENAGLAWVPTQLRDRFKLLVSATRQSVPGLLLGSRVGTEILDLEQMSREDAVDMIRHRAASMHRAVPPAVVTRLVARPRAPRWLVVATDLLFALITHDYLAVRSLPPGADPEAALAAMLTDITDELPDDVAELHEEAFLRLAEVIGRTPDTVILVLQRMATGLREADLLSILGSLGAPAHCLDMAVVRSVLAAHVAVVGEEWSFAHPTARLAATGLATSVEKEVPGSTDAYTSVIARHLLSQQPSDPVRVRELLPLLLSVADALPLLINLLGDPEQSPDESIVHLAAGLGAGLGTGWASTVRVAQALGRGSVVGRLTIIALITGTLPGLPVEWRESLAQVLVDQLVVLPAETRSRTGETPAQLRAVIEVIQASQPSPEMIESLVAQQLDAIASGLTLAEVLAGRRREDGVLPPLTRLWNEVQATFGFACLCAAGSVSPTEDDARAALNAIGSWQFILNRNVVGVDSMARPLISVAIAAVERVAQCSWPGAGLRSDPDDLRTATELADQRVGVTMAVIALAMVVRARTMELLRGPSLTQHVISAHDAVLLEDAMRMLEDCLWRLDAHRSLMPDDVALELAAIQLRGSLLSLLVASDQMSAAATVGVKLCSEPNIVALLGWPDFLHVAVTTVGAMDSSSSRVDAYFVVTSAIDGIASFGIPTDFDFPDLGRELLRFGLDNAGRSGVLRYVPMLIDKAEVLEAHGLVTRMATREVLCEFAASIIEELTDDDLVDELGELQEEDRNMLLDIADALATVAAALGVQHDHPGTVVIMLVANVVRWLVSGDEGTANHARHWLESAVRIELLSDEERTALIWSRRILTGASPTSG